MASLRHKYSPVNKQLKTALISSHGAGATRIRHTTMFKAKTYIKEWPSQTRQDCVAVISTSARIAAIPAHRRSKAYKSTVLLRANHQSTRDTYIQKKVRHLCLTLKRRLPTLPQLYAVPSALMGLTSLFGMGRGGTPLLLPPKSFILLPILFPVSEPSPTV